MLFLKLTGRTLEIYQVKVPMFLISGPGSPGSEANLPASAEDV
jgi:hypothetical protein